MSGFTGAVVLVAASVSHPSAVDVGTFAVAAAMVLSGAIGVVVARNPVHAALMLVLTLFGVAVLFVLQHDPFLAVVQVIVYAGAIVVLFLFVIMFLGVDREENIAVEPLRGQRPLAIGLVVLGTTGLLLLGQVSSWTTGAPHVAGVAIGRSSNVALLGRSVYTTYLFPFEATAALLIIAVVGAVVLARRPTTTAEVPSRGSDGSPTARGGGSGDVELATGGEPGDGPEPGSGPEETLQEPGPLGNGEAHATPGVGSPATASVSEEGRP